MASKSLPEEHPIAQAVAPLKQASVEAAVERAKEYLARMKKRVKEEPDQNTWAPYPSSRLGRTDYMIAKQRYHAVAALTKRDESKPFSYSFSSDQSRWIVWDETGAQQYLADTVRAAEQGYIAYVHKLIGKVERDGAVVETAKVVANYGVWSESILRVELASGAAEQWKTQMIVNCSVYGKVFNQFPTRLMKQKGK